MLQRKAKRGVATVCVSGGLGMALAIENVASPGVNGHMNQSASPPCYKTFAGRDFSAILPAFCGI
jgi:hypothetical protein